MKKICTLMLVCISIQATSQNNVTNNIIEGGRVLVDLFRVIKSPKMTTTAAFTATSTDSCASKAIADISYKNNSDKPMFISLYKRNGNLYSTIPLTLKVATKGKESLYEIQAGIYKYKIEYEDGEKRVTHKEGEIKLQPCDKLQQEI